MSASFNLQIITPNEVFFDGKAENVIVRTTVGDKGILANHEPYIAALPIGVMRVKLPDKDYRAAAISNGTICVAEGGDTVILVQSCEWSDEIDVSRAEIAKVAAEKSLNSSKNAGDFSSEFDIAEFKFKRALNRINAAGQIQK